MRIRKFLYRCARCGREFKVPGRTTYCPACGTRLTAEPVREERPKKSQHPPQPEQRSRRGLMGR